jgi:hypothetical protein
MSNPHERRLRNRLRVRKWRKRHAVEIRNKARALAASKWPESSPHPPQHRIWKLDGRLAFGMNVPPNAVILFSGMNRDEARRLLRFMATVLLVW